MISLLISFFFLFYLVVLFLVSDFWRGEYLSRKGALLIVQNPFERKEKTSAHEKASGNHFKNNDFSKNLELLKKIVFIVTNFLIEVISECFCFLFQVFSQILPKMQSELFEKCRKPKRHAKIPGITFKIKFLGPLIFFIQCYFLFFLN